jgi:hypothetical protein
MEAWGEIVAWSLGGENPSRDRHGHRASHHALFTLPSRSFGMMGTKKDLGIGRRSSLQGELGRPSLL